MVEIRKVAKGDALALLNLCKALDEETKFMLFERNERNSSVRMQSREIQWVLSSENSTIFVAEENGKLVGYLSAYGGQFQRIRHKAEVVIGILKDYTCTGIGTKLFQALETWGRETDIHRLELTVMKHNEIGMALYKKMGFSIEGIAKDSVRVDGKYVDEYYMAKVL